MNSIEILINQLDKISAKYNIISPEKKNNIYTLDQTLQLLNNLSTKNKKTNKNLTELDNLVLSLEDQICVKQSKNVDNILNEIIRCVQNETSENKKKCSEQIKQIINENYLNINIKKKLVLLIDLINK